MGQSGGSKIVQELRQTKLLTGKAGNSIIHLQYVVRQLSISVGKEAISSLRKLSTQKGGITILHISYIINYTIPS
jgi:hypothetical protein